MPRPLETRPETASQVLLRAELEAFAEEIPARFAKAWVVNVAERLTDSKKVAKLMTREERAVRAEALERFTRLWGRYLGQ